MPKFDSIKVGLNIPGMKVEGTWTPNKAEIEAAWELYVELITRISVVELKPGKGILREALTSNYSIFQTTRDILRKYGPIVAEHKGKNEYSFGELSVYILNYVLRPLLETWHPLLQDYESKRDSQISIKEHEDNWELNSELRNELEKTRRILVKYSYYLAKVAKVKPLHTSYKKKRRKK